MKPRQLLPIGAGVCLRIIFLIIAVQNPVNLIVNDNYLHSGYVWATTHQYLSTEYPPLTAWICRVAIGLSATYAPDIVVGLNVALSCAALWMTYLTTTALTRNENIGIAATWIAAIDPLCLLIPVFILSEGVYFFLLSLLLLLLSRICNSDDRVRRVAGSIAAGAVLGLMILSRETGYLIGGATLLGLLVLGRSKTLSLQTPAILAGTAFLVILPWSLQNLKSYGRFATSSSSSFNMAALLVRPAKVIADGHDSVGMLGPWETLLPAETTADNPYAYDERAKSVALNWAATNKMLVAKTIVQGTILRQVAPGDEFAYALIHPVHGGVLPPYLNGLANKFGEASRNLGLKMGLTAIRLLVFLLTCCGVYRFLRIKEKILGLKLFLVILIISDFALGPIHAGRFVYSLLPVWYPFAGIGLVHLLGLRSFGRPIKVAAETN